MAVTSEALGLELRLERAEEPIGPFLLDLIGHDLTHDTTLVVENQIERSDHTHLGQLLTYSAGSAGTIIWIAKSFCEEHRVALDWLNQHTGEGTRFFGVVVRALRVGDSEPAPFIEVVARPSDWQKAVQRTVVRNSADNLAYRSFWEPLRERLVDEAPDLLKGRAEPKSIWLTMNSPIAGTAISGEIGSGELRAVLEIDTGDREGNLALLEQLRRHRAAIESEVGEVDFREGKYRCRIVCCLPWNGKLLTQPDRQDEARDWFHDHLLRMRRGLEVAAAVLPGPN